MAIASKKFWNKYPEARAPRKHEPDIPYVDFAIVHRILVADGKVFKGELPVLSTNDLLYVRCSDDERANVMRYQGKWYALTRADARKLWRSEVNGARVYVGR